MPTEQELKELGLILCKMRLNMGALRFYEEEFPNELKLAGLTPELKEVLDQYASEQISKTVRRDIQKEIRNGRKKNRNRSLKGE